MRIALVYDRVNKFGGAERVLRQLHEIWPDAPIFTAVYDRQNATWADVFQIRPSFLQYIPLARRHHEWFAWATPMAFESFSFDEFEVVLSITSAEAKGIITKPGTLHICYCLTPTRYLWSGAADYAARVGIGVPKGLTQRIFSALLPTLQSWDRVASARPDHYIAISHMVAGRISKYYHRNSTVIYPPVDTDTFHVNQASTKSEKGGYFLTVSRLVGYKRMDLVIAAFNRLGWPLVVIGDGQEKKTLQKQAKSNITFVSGHLTDALLAHYYEHCRAFVFAGVEDFGIVAAEAQSCGKPVIAYKQSGIAEIIVDGKTGLLFDTQNVQDLVSALEHFDREWYDSDLCRKNALRFSVNRFKKEMKTTVEDLYAHNL